MTKHHKAQIQVKADIIKMDAKAMHQAIINGELEMAHFWAEAMQRRLDDILNYTSGEPIRSINDIDYRAEDID